MTEESLAAGEGQGESALDVFRNRPFLLLWLAQAATQIGGNMVIFGLTVIISKSTNSTTAVSALILTFLVPAVLFSAVAGVFVDRMDRRIVLIVTNVLRGAAFIGMFFVGDNLILIYLLNIFVSTVTVFFAPAEAAMIPMLLPKKQLLAANGIFTLTLNAAFALGFALLGPLVVKIAGGAEAVILLVAVFYFIAAGFTFTLPSAPPTAPGRFGRAAIGETEHAVGSVFGQLGEGLSYIRVHREIRWSLIYLGVAASLVGVLGVLGPQFAETTLGLQEEDFFVVVLPLGVGLVMGILLLNNYGRLLPRRRVIEGGLVALGALILAMALSGRISAFLSAAEQASPLPDLSLLTSLLAIVVAVAFLAGIAYAFVAIPAQTQLQEDIPPDVRGRVFGVLNMLVSVASFLPILVVGPIADLLGTTIVLSLVAIAIFLSGIASILVRGSLNPIETRSRYETRGRDPFAAALTAADLPTPDPADDAADVAGLTAPTRKAAAGATDGDGIAVDAPTAAIEVTGADEPPVEANKPAEADEPPAEVDGVRPTDRSA